MINWNTSLFWLMYWLYWLTLWWVASHRYDPCFDSSGAFIYRYIECVCFNERKLRLCFCKSHNNLNPAHPKKTDNISAIAVAVAYLEVLDKILFKAHVSSCCFTHKELLAIQLKSNYWIIIYEKHKSIPMTANTMTSLPLNNLLNS